MDDEERRRKIKNLAEPLAKSKGWMKFLGIASMVLAALMVPTGCGILVAWIPLWLGVVLLQTVEKIEDAHSFGTEESLLLGMDKLRTSFKMAGILVLIIVIFALIVGFLFLQGMLFTPYSTG